jgi:hypothetical protein
MVAKARRRMKESNDIILNDWGKHGIAIASDKRRLLVCLNTSVRNPSLSLAKTPNGINPWFKFEGLC